MTARVAVRLTPRGGADRVDGVGEDGSLHARVAAAPVEGAANEALRRLLARELRIAAGSVRVVGGATSRRKVVELDAAGDAVEALWPGVRVETRP